MASAGVPGTSAARAVALAPADGDGHRGSRSLAQIVIEMTEEQALGKKGPDGQRRGGRLEGFIAPRLASAGLEARAFYGLPRGASGVQCIYLEISAPPARLLLEAERLKWPLLLDAGKLRAADIAENTRLQSAGLCFSEDGKTLYGDELAIPIAKLPCAGGCGSRIFACLASAPRDPYAYAWAPYDPRMHHLFAQHPETNTVLRQADALQLLRSAIISPHDIANGAGIELDSLLAKGFVKKVWAAHDAIQQEELERHWGSTALRAVLQSIGILHVPPLSLLSNYYGEGIAFYFAFLAFMTRALLTPAIVGIVVFAVGPSSWLPVYGIFVSLWSTIFYEGWKRTQGDWAMKWGKEAFTKTVEPQRAEFANASGSRKKRSEIDGKVITHFSPITYNSKLMAATVAVSVFIGICIIIVLSIFLLRATLTLRIRDWGIVWTALINSLQIQIMTVLYNWMAHKLTVWENHSTDSSFNNSLIIKRSVFQSTNYFFSLVWAAGLKNSFVFQGVPQACPPGANDVPDCLSELQLQLAIIMIADSAYIIFLEVILPALSPILEPVTYVLLKAVGAQPDMTRSERLAFEAQCSPPELEASLEPYNPANDYMELLIQFGFVTLFAPAFPLVGVIAVLTNMLEAAVDTRKVLYRTSRPIPAGAEGIGAWGVCFEAYTLLSALSNLGVVVFSYSGPLFGSFVVSYNSRLIVFLVASYGLYAIKWVIVTLIPDTTWTTLIQLERRRYLVSKHLYGVKDPLIKLEEDEEEEGGGEGGGGRKKQRTPVRPRGTAAAFMLYDSYASAEAGAHGGGGGQQQQQQQATPGRVAPAPLYYAPSQQYAQPPQQQPYALPPIQSPHVRGSAV